MVDDEEQFERGAYVNWTYRRANTPGHKKPPISIPAVVVSRREMERRIMVCEAGIVRIANAHVDKLTTRHEPLPDWALPILAKSQPAHRRQPIV